MNRLAPDAGIARFVRLGQPVTEGMSLDEAETEILERLDAIDREIKI